MFVDIELMIMQTKFARVVKCRGGKENSKSEIVFYNNLLRRTRKND